VIDLFRTMNQEKAITFVIVTHNKDIALQAKSSSE